MINKQDLHLAYVLHTRPYRETSLLVEVLSAEHGRVAMVARGAKRGKSKDSSILQPFIALNVSWYGSGELVTMTAVEMAQQNCSLQGKRAICGLYLNEILVKLLHKWDPCANLFAQYELALQNLTQVGTVEQITLRKFEKELLKSLGYALQLTMEVDSGDPVLEHEYYTFDPILGPRMASSAHSAAYKGASLLALGSDHYPADTLLDIKRLMRNVLAHHLGTKQIVTRQLL